ncbi:hypothetical protein EDEG_00076 [Edhazardia aedis USNM 41457]|uniref:Uncharacterized protein n=1 Tax=Edhazardia aedis (strain USNM 41457) TaxID=1003232 RepID=J9DBU0_EDHAE|nr:hypothetical protein EDEG_00076 [Edhazardia aedis USNM 41457]|eukprot:EJW04959.1 hypothetical protein EDEG_00076 [Edhazardia aedis USNM 41457]
MVNNILSIKYFIFIYRQRFTRNYLLKFILSYFVVFLFAILIDPETIMSTLYLRIARLIVMISFRTFYIAFQFLNEKLEDFNSIKLHNKILYIYKKLFFLLKHKLLDFDYSQI